MIGYLINICLYKCKYFTIFVSLAIMRCEFFSFLRINGETVSNE